MDTGKEKQIKRVFKRILNKLLKEYSGKVWSPQVKDIMVDTSASQLLKEVTIRTYIP